MTLRTRDTIRAGVAGPMRDVGPLYTVSGFAFDDPDQAKVEENLSRAADLPDVAWLDLRGATDDEARVLMAQHANASTLVLVVDVARSSSPVSLFLRQARDGKASVDIGSGERMDRAPDQSVIVVAQGRRDVAEAPFELQRIDTWETDRPRLY